MDETQKANLRMNCLIKAVEVKKSCGEGNIVKLAKEFNDFVLGEEELKH